MSKLCLIVSAGGCLMAAASMGLMFFGELNAVWTGFAGVFVAWLWSHGL